MTDVLSIGPNTHEVVVHAADERKLVSTCEVCEGVVYWRIGMGAWQHAWTVDSVLGRDS